MAKIDVMLLNEILNDALCKPGRIKGMPTSNKIAIFVDKWIKNKERKWQQSIK